MTAVSTLHRTTLALEAARCASSASADLTQTSLLWVTGHHATYDTDLEEDLARALVWAIRAKGGPEHEEEKALDAACRAFLAGEDLP